MVLQPPFNKKYKKKTSVIFVGRSVCYKKKRQFILLKYKYGPDFNFFSELVYYLKNYYYKYGKGVLSLLVLQCEGGRAKRAAEAEKGNF